MTDRISELAAALATSETERMVAATPRSKALYDRAVRVLPEGVGSSFQAGDPYPLYLERGQGSHVWDVDGHEYLDFHNGFGCMIVGHAHPKVAEAIAAQAQRFIHAQVNVFKHDLLEPLAAKLAASNRGTRSPSGSALNFAAFKRAPNS